MGMELTASLDEGRRALPDTWSDWIADGVARGCNAQALLSVMVAEGFAADFAQACIETIRGLVRRGKIDNLPLAAAAIGYRPDPCRISRDDRIVARVTSPNIVVFGGLLTDVECDEIIDRAAPKMVRSTVLNRTTGGGDVSRVRTSDGTHFERGAFAAISAIEQRIADLTGIPIDHGEPIQVLRYRVGGEYKAHHDYFEPADPGSQLHTATGGQRVATAVMYLNDVEEGGATDFPVAGVRVQARRGAACYFEYRNAAGELDERCRHAGMPVIQGEKWIATKWLRESVYRR